MDTARSRRAARRALLSVLLLAAACAGLRHRGRDGGSPSASADPVAAELRRIEHGLIETTCRFQPTVATSLGLHHHDAELEDYSRDGVMAEVAALQQWKHALAALDPAGLALADQLDRELMAHAVDSRLLTLTEVRPWATNPDFYSSGITNTAYVMMKWAFAPADVRLRALMERERRMPAALAAARANLANPPRILTEIALDQIDGSRDLFASALPEAFAEVKDPALVSDFKAANVAVLAALDDYKRWMKEELLPRSNGDFALGAETYRKKLAADEMVDVPLERLLDVATADLKKNQAWFRKVAGKIDPSKAPADVLAALQSDHPPAAELLAKTQAELDSIAAFLTEHRIVTIPKGAPARVQETPPFARATTSASMEAPGPFEKIATDAWYSMTLPDPAWDAKKTEEFMQQWYYPMITNVSVHEMWPGHYLQFLYNKQFPSDARKVFGVNTNIEGWAHYGEQMMNDEGFHADDPRYRLAQLQDALLRDVRFVVGIRMHTQGMTVEQAKEMFEKEAYQPAPVAESEAKRGTTDATYGYYTLGKLMIMKLRADLKAKQGDRFSLQDFHDTFLKLGPLPIPLIRRAMLGEGGELF